MNYIQMVEIEIKVSFLKIHVSSQFQNCDNMTITLYYITIKWWI